MIHALAKSTFAPRLPILQGTSFAFVAASIAVLTLPENQCPEPLPEGFRNSTIAFYNDTDGTIVDARELWMKRVRQVSEVINR